MPAGGLYHQSNPGVAALCRGGDAVERVDWSGRGCSPADARAQWKTIVSLLNQDGSRPRIAAEFALSDYEQVFAALARSPFGKIVINIC